MAVWLLRSLSFTTCHPCYKIFLMVDGQKWVWILTGPNGAGKSTVRAELPQEIRDLPSLNLDDYAAAHSRSAPANTVLDSYLAGGERMMGDFKNYLANGTSFTVEMCMPSNVLGRSIASMQADGWKIGVIAVGIDSKDTGNRRVAARVAQGGHRVEAAELKWDLCKQSTEPALHVADRFMVYDNSGTTPELVATKEMKYGPVAIHQPPTNDYTKTILSGFLNQTPSMALS